MPIRAEHRFELFDEVVDVFELAINRGKADKRDLVDRSQPIENLLPDIAGGDLAVEILIDVGFDVANKGLDLTFADGPLVTGLFRPARIFSRSNGTRVPSFLITLRADSSIFS